MAAGKGELTLAPALFPPGTAAVHSVNSYGLPGHAKTSLVGLVASMGSLVADLVIRSSVGSGISPSAVNRLPVIPSDHGLADRKSTRLNSSHVSISYAVFCLQKKTKRPAM